MSVKTVRKAKHQKLYQGRPKFSIEKVSRSNWSGMSLIGTHVTPELPTEPTMPKRVRPFKSTKGGFPPAPFPTPSPKAAEDVDHGREGPPANPRND